MVLKNVKQSPIYNDTHKWENKAEKPLLNTDWLGIIVVLWLNIVNCTLKTRKHSYVVSIFNVDTMFWQILLLQSIASLKLENKSVDVERVKTGSATE